MNQTKITKKNEALVILSDYGWRLDMIPEKLKTAEICQTALKQNSKAIKHVPDELYNQLKYICKKTQK